MLGARAALAGVVIALIAGRQANADGCFFRLEEVGRSSQLVASPKQEAILATDGNMVQAVLRTHFRAGPRELAWVVPVPARPANIQKGDDSVFTKLEDITAPRFYRIITDDGLHPKFGCDAGVRQLSVASAPVLVRVEETGTAGIFDYTVLAAEDPSALTKWLNDNKYHVPDGAAAILKRYVDRRWHWLAMKVRPEAGKQGTLAPHPIRYTYRSKELVFPLVISRLSADRESEIVLYVVGPHRYCCSGWGNITLADFAQSREIRQVAKTAANSDTPRSGTNYEELVRQQTVCWHGGHLFVTEFSKRWDLFGSSAGRGRRFDDVLDPKLIDSLAARQILTRLRAYVPAEAMDRDVTLIAAKEDHWVDNSAQVAAASAGPSGPGALAVVPVMLLLPFAASVMPICRKASRIIRRVCLALACVAILAA